MRYFLQCWKSKIADYTAGQPLDHCSSNQLGKASQGDVLWCVTIRDHRLKLLGRLVIDEVTSQRAAVRKLGRTDLYHARYHVIAKKGTVHTTPLNRCRRRMKIAITTFSDCGLTRALTACAPTPATPTCCAEWDCRNNRLSIRAITCNERGT